MLRIPAHAIEDAPVALVVLTAYFANYAQVELDPALAPVAAG